jgi:hypothetical protein
MENENNINQQIAELALKDIEIISVKIKELKKSLKEFQEQLVKKNRIRSLALGENLPKKKYKKKEGVQ